MSRIVRFATVATLLLTALAACGGDDSSSSTAAGETTSVSTTALTTSTMVAPTTTVAGTSAPTPTTTAKAASGTTSTTTARPPATTTTTQAPTTTTAPPHSTLAMSIATYMFSPSHPKVRAGSVTVSVKNNDPFDHTFTVTGTSIDIAATSGKTTSATATLAPGDYEFHCKIHSSMTGTLTVTS